MKLTREQWSTPFSRDPFIINASLLQQSEFNDMKIVVKRLAGIYISRGRELKIIQLNSARYAAASVCCLKWNSHWDFFSLTFCRVNLAQKMQFIIDAICSAAESSFYVGVKPRLSFPLILSVRNNRLILAHCSLQGLFVQVIAFVYLFLCTTQLNVWN